MKLLIIKTKAFITDQIMTNLYERLKVAKKEGVMILDGNFDYEVVEFDSLEVEINDKE